MKPPLTLAEQILEQLKQPKTSQQLRDAMPCKGVETEEVLYELRDEGCIAYANGAWYKLGTGRLLRKRAVKKPHPRQLGLFGDE